MTENIENEIRKLRTNIISEMEKTFPNIEEGTQKARWTVIIAIDKAIKAGMDYENKYWLTEQERKEKDVKSIYNRRSRKVLIQDNHFLRVENRKLRRMLAFSSNKIEQLETKKKEMKKLYEEVSKMDTDKAYLLLDQKGEIDKLKAEKAREIIFEEVRTKIKEHENCITYHEMNGKEVTCLDMVLSWVLDEILKK
jgi:regulator of replication initiation timing